EELLWERPLSAKGQLGAKDHAAGARYAGRTHLNMEDKMPEDDVSLDQKPSGARAIVGAAIAVVGALAAARPTSAILQAIHVAAPQVANAIPAVITACGAVIAAFSTPPRLKRKQSPSG